MKFKITEGWGSGHARNVILLYADNWDDYGNKTTFHASYCDSTGEEHQLGTVKIGMESPDSDDNDFMDFTGRTSDYLNSEFESLPANFFSLWQSAEAYKLVLECENNCHFNILEALNDISYNPSIYEKYKNEDAMENSLFRSVSYSLYFRQFRRIARGEAVLTSYDFSYLIKNDNRFVEDCELTFSVTPDVLPPTNIHAVIGSNGVGKTTLIKNMVKSICKNDNTNGMFKYTDTSDEDEVGSFENTICISFNPFDDYSEVEMLSKNFNNISIRKEFEPVSEDAYEDCYGELSVLDDVQMTFMSSLKNCLMDMTKRKDLRDTLDMLETEFNFISSNYDFDINIDASLDDILWSASEAFNQLSAGHKVVLSIITRCIDVLVEKSVVFIDEPENHLHPPLLSSLIRGISRMLIKRNGVAIISTHSPIVLQEIPKSCVWILRRDGNIINARRPEIETFGTNIGNLMNEIFGFEIKRTGFNRLLQNAVDRCEDYESVLEEFNYQLGDEAKSIVRMMLKQKNAE
ncbi:ABC-type multidrug transport system, ATPase component [Pseudobutyrivibrio sp. NOR37]|nr:MULTISPECIES: AAA family ATPase [Pseudobutyrivibrio]SFR66590.1 ABC-type multidrug transport system, ATPase component [Pseudobutyrivibrio sp. NOR37]